MREDLSLVLSNRSAAYLESGDTISALVDAEVVVQLRRPWSKGHFRKARALLKLDRYEEAKEAVLVGLSFEPDNKVGDIFRNDYICADTALRNWQRCWAVSTLLLSSPEADLWG